MPLSYLLYRCPRCGQDPLQGEKDQVTCTQCGVSFSRAGEGGLIRVEDPSGGIWEVPGHRLTQAMEAMGPEEEGESQRSEGLIREARVKVRESGAEAPVRWGGELLGFAEAMGEPEFGTVRLFHHELVLRLDPPPAADGGGASTGAGDGREGGGFSKRWPLLEIRAVQTSSSSLQFSPASGGLVELRFESDSTFRWENLLRNTLREAYRTAGLGEIVEFQPRIVAE